MGRPGRINIIGGKIYRMARIGVLGGEDQGGKFKWVMIRDLP